MTEPQETDPGTGGIPLGTDADGNTLFWDPAITTGHLAGRNVIVLRDEVQELFASLSSGDGKSADAAAVIADLIRQARRQGRSVAEEA
jgi:hypothetical protein